MLINKYPIYIISKGRAYNPLTANALDKIGIPYKIVIEPNEYGEYLKVIDSKKILILPFSDLGQGSIPARNWIWEHSIEQGATRHWILDDNIMKFYRVNNNELLYARTKAIFISSEDFVDRYENVALAGLQYSNYGRNIKNPYKLNTRIYSCILIKNDIPYRWRGKYNEDTDLSLRVLKDGYVTVLFNNFLIDKTGTMRMKGGNTTELYEKDNDNRLKFAKSLMEQHPDVVKITKKFGRWHHQVDYRPFKKNKLIRKEGIEIPDVVNNYGMKLIKIK